jgi:serine protease Do
VVNISTGTRSQGTWSRHGEETFRRFFEKYFGRPYLSPNRSLGSGLIINRQGYILTNSHVIEGAENIVVTLWDKREYKAQVVGRDEKTDIALIKIDAAENLPVVPLGDSDRLEIGEWVIAIGNPYGYSHSVTAGIVSAKGRQIGAGPYDNFIQTDASINPGNSGGPLINTRGEVVGINTAIVAPGQGIGFAIPINMVKALLPQLLERGKVVRGWLGVNLQEVDQRIAEEFGLSSPSGALVTNVIEGQPASKAGLQEGDIILRFNGRAIDGVRALQRAVASVPVGTRVELDVFREGSPRTFSVVIGERREEDSLLGHEVQTGFGMVVEEITQALKEKYTISAGSGILVTQVDEGTPAQASGLRLGDVILEVDRKPVRTLKDYLLRIGEARRRRGRSVLLLVQRGDKSFYVALKLGDGESEK